MLPNNEPTIDELDLARVYFVGYSILNYVGYMCMFVAFVLLSFQWS